MKRKQILEEIELEIEYNGFDGISRARELKEKIREDIDRYTGSQKSRTKSTKKHDKIIKEMALKFNKR